MICPRCTAAIADDYLYCPRCGQSTAPRAAGEDTSPPTAPPDSISAAVRSEQDPTSSTDIMASAPVTAGSIDPKTRDGEWRSDFFALSEEEINSCLAQANLYRVRGQWIEAIDKCVMALRAQPGNPTAHSLLGDIYRDRGNPAEAVQWYRMAVDLRPNPSAEAKLRQMEKESALRDAQNGSASVSSGATGVPGGTSALMGVSPRRWLNSITVVSLAFLALMAMALYVNRSNAQREVEVARPLPSDGALNPVTDRHLNDILPPIQPRGTTVLPSGEKRRDTSPTPYTGGSGLPPDLTPSSTPAAPPANTGSPQEPGKSGSNMLPAPVGSVRPMPTPSSSGVVDSGNANTPVPYEPAVKEEEKGEQ